eukprot:TRINITY_DN60145_c0_g1_i1.p1 TRINITY_DN60145_c0_g1~~TRINITY_DN60145_c0_g1_i1.p1  ORF type:complete len:517 (-),score=132.91 TRINITY_DN60145_c0_g1_i1:119-1597(-)
MESTPSVADTVSDINRNQALSFVVLGASGDLAKKKTFPALYQLHKIGFLNNANVIGYARRDYSTESFREYMFKILSALDDDTSSVDSFVEKLYYKSGLYDDSEKFDALDEFCKEIEAMNPKSKIASNRIFYYAIPPSQFANVSKAMYNSSVLSNDGFDRIVIEKPFGHDSESSCKLATKLKKYFREDQIYRIDHYLGKEMVQNLLISRFGNAVFEPLWNRHNIEVVKITFKEDIGVEGRGGYFDNYGIIRDVMQNHLLQVLSLVAMESPVSFSARDIRDEKVKVLRCIEPISADDMIIGQYGADRETGLKPAYVADPTVKPGSTTPTFAQAVFHVDNPRWQGVPFILKCGKGLDERKAEIRIQFKTPPGKMFNDDMRNELVIRIQPNDAMYLKLNVKQPGLSTTAQTTEMDLTYNQRFKEDRLPDAYERLILDVIRGDQSSFVRVDELQAAWRILTPVLHELENNPDRYPCIYSFGSRGPVTADRQTERLVG